MRVRETYPGYVFSAKEFENGDTNLEVFEKKRKRVESKDTRKRFLLWQ